MEFSDGGIAGLFLGKRLISLAIPHNGGRISWKSTTTKKVPDTSFDWRSRNGREPTSCLLETRRESL